MTINIRTICWISIVLALVWWSLQPGVFFYCKIKFEEGKDIDWDFVRSELALRVNSQNDYGALTANDIEIFMPKSKHSKIAFNSYDYLGFQFEVKIREKVLSGSVNRCGQVEVRW